MSQLFTPFASILRLFLHTYIKLLTNNLICPPIDFNLKITNKVTLYTMFLVTGYEFYDQIDRK